jgi:hypothetical protein
MGLWRLARASSTGGGMYHVSPGQPAATRELVIFAKFIEKWSFLVFL